MCPRQTLRVNTRLERNGLRPVSVMDPARLFLLIFNLPGPAPEASLLICDQEKVSYSSRWPGEKPVTAFGAINYISQHRSWEGRKGRAASFFYLFFLTSYLWYCPTQDFKKKERSRIGVVWVRNWSRQIKEKRLLYCTPVDLADSFLGRFGLFFSPKAALIFFFGLVRFKWNWLDVEKNRKSSKTA